MNPIHFLLVLRARYKVAVFVLVVAVMVGIAVSLLQPRQYTTSTALVFEIRQEPMTGMLLPTIPGYIATQTEIIKSDRVAQKVVKALDLDKNPAARQQWMVATEGKGQLDVWLVELMKRNVRVTPSPGSNIITLAYTASDPGFAVLATNAFAQAFIDTSIELKVDPARQYSRWFGEQGKTLRENVEKAQARLSEFQQQKGIVARDEQLDIETANLNALSTQLSIVQGFTVDAESKRRSGADTLPEVLGNTVISGIRSEIVRQEAKLQEVAVNFGSNHPQYLRMQTEIAALKQKLDTETRHFTSSFSTSRAVSKDRESELNAAIAAQKRKVLQLKNDRDQLAVLQRDVDAAQRAYDTVTQRFNQTNLESQATQTNVSVLTSAVEPLEPSSPNVPRIMMIAVAIGILLGCGVAFLLEQIDRRIRSADDLAEMLQLPVLAVIQRSRRSSRLLFWRRKTALALR